MNWNKKLITIYTVCKRRLMQTPNPMHQAPLVGDEGHTKAICRPLVSSMEWQESDAEICWRLTTRPTWDGDVEAYSEADLYFSLWKIWRSVDSPLNQFIFAIWISTGSGPQEAYAKLTKAKYKNFHGLITKAENKRNVQKINTWNHKSFLVSTCAFKPLFHI